MAEQEEVKSWLRADSNNQKYYDELRRIWEDARDFAITSPADENLAWQRFRKKLRKEASSRAHVPWRKIAASLILLIGVGVLVWLLLNGPVDDWTITASNAVRMDTLPDGSTITLNRGSSIVYPSTFDRRERNVALRGEGFFNVKPDKARPFIIRANKATIRVVGTAFNVKSNDTTTEVIVESGVVRVSGWGKTVEVRPGKKAVVDQRDSSITTNEVTDKLYNYYRTKEFVCVETPLWKLVEVINEAYQSKILISNPELNNMSITTTFNNESLDQVLRVISITFNIKVSRVGDSIILE